MADSWTTIESDPGVFTELMTEMGVVDVQVLHVSRPLPGLRYASPVHTHNTRTWPVVRPYYCVLFQMEELYDLEAESLNSLRWGAHLYPQLDQLELPLASATPPRNPA